MIFPKKPKPGALVGLAAPASPVSEQECCRCVRQLKTMGYRVLPGETLYQPHRLRGYLAGEAGVRARDLNRMFADPDVEAVFCVRGGYGSAQLLEYLDYDCIRKNPKAFIGYSDVTSLHGAIQKHCGLVTFHGPMVKSDMINGLDDYSKKSLYAALGMKTGESVAFCNPPGEEFTVIREGSAHGRLVGGNLSVFARSLGTAYVPDTRGCILFLEDTGESIQRLDMYLTQLRLAGIFEEVEGVLLGGFIKCPGEGANGVPGAEDFLYQWFGALSIPVLGNLYSDHRSPTGTLPLGCLCRMDARQQMILFERQML